MFDLSLLSGAQPEPTVIFLMGPTASGKTALAVEWAQHFPVDIISVDSAMVYRGMDIGTAKPSPAILARAPHRLIDMCAPHQPYSAGQFRHDALREIADIMAKGRIPLLVGGTMLYFRALQELATLPTADPTVRAAIAAEMTEKGVPALHAQLATIDPIAADRIHPCDAQRIQRALEVHTLTGQSLTTLHAAQETEQLPFRVVKWVVMPTDRRLLHERIARRFGEMLEQGFVAEVETLRARGDLTADMPSMRAVGYRQAWAYLDGLMTYREMVERAIIATRQLAKRQCTWLRGENLHQR